MKVELLHYTPLSVCDYAICKCYGNKPHEDLEKQQARINRVANVSKHSSTVEHIVFSFDIDGCSRAVLQEIVRHRVSSYTIKSSRYTLKELKDAVLMNNIDSYDWNEINKFCVLTNNRAVDLRIAESLFNLQYLIINNVSNDIAKYSMPEAYKTSLVMTINARSLQNFLSLRTSPHALWEIRQLAYEMYNQIPDDHKFLFDDVIYKDNNEN